MSTKNAIHNLEREMIALLHKAYQQGASDTKAAILQAVQSPGQVPAPLTGTWTGASAKIIERQRAPKGLIRRVLKTLLEVHGPSSLQEIESLIPMYDTQVSPKSAGTELRRGESEGIYIRDKNNNWSLNLDKVVEELIGQKE